MSPSPQWYLDQAAVLSGRADECRRLASELDLSPLPDLLSRAGDDTWQSPAAGGFREQVLLGQRMILDAIAALETNAYGLAGEADDLARHAAVEAERRRQSSEASAAARRELDRVAPAVD